MREIALEDLPEADLEQIARNSSRRVFDVDVPPPVIHALVERADGNPFFLEESIHLLNERGLDPRSASASHISELPDSLSSLALARLDALRPDDHALVKLASVLGRRFDTRWASGSFPELGSPADVQQQLDGLRAPDLVRRVGTSEYAFKHGVIRDAAYATLALSLREELHERVGRYVERSYGDELDRYVDDLAYHYGESRDVAKQRVYLRRAADAARAAYSNESALGWLERLLPVSDPEAKSDVLRDLGELRQLLGQWDAAAEVFAQALAAAEGSGDRLAVARCRASIGRLRSYTSSFEEARRWLEEARSAFESEDDPAGLLRTLEHLAFAAWQSSAYEESMDYSARHLDVAQRLDDGPAICMAIEQMGLVHWHRGEYDEARAEFERALGQADRSGFVWGVIHSSNDLAGLFSEQGDHLSAFESVRRGIESAEEIGYRHALGVMIGNAGELYRIHGDPETAIECACAGLAITAELPDWPDVVAKVGNIALALRDSGKPEQAGTFFEAAIALARAIDDPYLLCEFLHAHAGLLASDGSVEAARAANDEALAIASRIDRRDVRFGAELLSIDLAVAGGDLDPAIASKAAEDFADLAVTEGERAAVDHAVWRLTSDPEAQRRAAERSRRMHDDVPRADDRRRYLELTGEELTPPAPLPPLPGAEDWDAPHLDGVLARVQELLARIATERPPDPSPTPAGAV